MVVAANTFLTPRRLALGLLALGVAGISGSLITAYLQREAIGVRFALDFLRAHGVPADIHLDRLDLKGASGSMRLGPWWRPDLVVPHLEVRFRAVPVTRKGVGAPQVRSLELDGAVLHGRWRHGRLEFGTLQSLIDQSLHAKPSGQPPPDLYIRDGRLILDTPQGPVKVALDASVEGGHVRDAHIRLEPLDVTLGGVRLAAVQGVLSAAPLGGGRLHLTAAFGAERGRGRAGAASGLALTAEGLAPDSLAGAPGGGDRPLDASFHLKIGRAALQPARAAPVTIQGADLSVDIDGVLDAHNRFAGRVHGGGQVAALAQGEAAASSVRVQLNAPQATATVDAQGLAASGPFAITLDAGGARVKTAAGTALVGPTRLSATGQAALGRRLRVTASGALQGSAGLARADATRLAARLTGSVDARATAAVARALTHARLDVPAYAASFESGQGGSLRLPKGASMRFANGGLELKPVGAGPVLQTGPRRTLAGGAALSARIKDLPELDLVTSAYRIGPDGASAQVAASLRGGLGPVEGAALTFKGEVMGRDRSWSGVASDCAEVRAALVRSAGQPAVRDLKAALCPAPGAPLFVVDRAGWRTRTEVRDAVATLPQAAVHAALQSADVTLAGGHAPLAGEIALKGLAVQDVSPSPRVRPLLIGGGVGLGAGAVEGRFNLSLAERSVPLGALTLRARLADGTGSAEFDSGAVRLARQGLQAGDIAPALAKTLPDADGALQLRAQASWTRAGLGATSGELRLDGLSFKSPAGRLDGLRGDVGLASLLPLRSAPAQTLEADRLETLLPLTGLKAVFTLTPQAVAVQSASAELAGGRVSLDPTQVALQPGAPIAGVLRLQGVQLEKVISAFNLSNAVNIDAKVGGELPFTLAAPAGGSPAAVRIEQGRIFAEEPGRLSIQRQALGAAVTTAGAEGAQPNAVQDFAYQALENLAFSKLEASIASRPAGRLGVVFHVVGRHDPKVDRPTRVGLLQLLRGHAFDKPLPLPKGTPVDLTLDTSLNLDELLASYAALNGESGSAKVQP